MKPRDTIRPERRSLRATALAALTLALGACGGARTDTLDFEPIALVAAEDGAIVVTPRDGRYGRKIYEGSGYEVARRVRRALLHRVRVAETIPYTTVDEAERICARRGARFLVWPEIHHWEDRATQWSSIPDQVQIDLTLVDRWTDARRRLRFVANGWWLALVDDAVQELLDEDFEDAVLWLLADATLERPPRPEAPTSVGADDEDDGAFSIRISR